MSGETGNTTMSGDYEDYEDYDTVNDDGVSYNVSPDVPPFVYIISCCFMAIICVFGVVSNSSIFVLFINSPLIRTPFNCILMNLVFAEMFIASYGLPIDFTASITFGWKLGRKLCLATGFILTSSGTVSILTLAALSLQRYLTIVNPDRFKVTSYKSSFMIIAGIWIYTMFIAVPPFFGFGAYVPETSGMTCAPDWESNKHIIFTIYWLFTGFLIPLVVIIFSSYKTVLSLKEQTKFTKSEAIKRMSQKREQKICALVIWMNVAFLVCWMPYGVICIMYILGGRGYVSPTVVVIPLLTAKTSVCWNPIIYIAMNPQFRGAFKKFFKTRDEKELERRWTRINRNGPTHLGCVQAPASSQIRGSFVKNKYRKSSARFLKIMKNPEYSSRNEWSNPNCIDYSITSPFTSYTPWISNQVEMKAAALLNVRNLAIGVIIAHQTTRPKAIVEVAETSKDNPTQAVIQVDMHNMELRSSRASYREEDEEDQCEENEEKFELKKLDKSTQFNQLGSDESDDNQDNSVEEIKVPTKKVIKFQKDPQRTSQPNGWIYACFEPVEIAEDKDVEEKKSFLIKNSNRPCYMDFLNDRNDLLNALNLMSFNDASNGSEGTTLLVSEDALIRNFPLTATAV